VIFEFAEVLVAKFLTPVHLTDSQKHIITSYSFAIFSVFLSSVDLLAFLSFWLIRIIHGQFSSIVAFQRQRNNDRLTGGERGDFYSSVTDRGAFAAAPPPMDKQ